MSTLNIWDLVLRGETVNGPSTTDTSPAGLTVTRSAGVCGRRDGDRVRLAPGGGPGGGMSAGDGGTDTQRGDPSCLGAEEVGGTVEGGRAPNGYSGAGV